MAKRTKITVGHKRIPQHPNKKLSWKIKAVGNWCYDKWMELRGYKRYGFNFHTNTYIYEKKSEIEKWEQDDLDEDDDDDDIEVLLISIPSDPDIYQRLKSGEKRKSIKADIISQGTKIKNESAIHISS